MPVGVTSGRRRGHVELKHHFMGDETEREDDKLDFSGRIDIAGVKHGTDIRALNVIPKGLGVHERVGNQIMLLKMRLKMYIEPGFIDQSDGTIADNILHAVELGIEDLVAVDSTILRYIVIYDERPCPQWTHAVAWEELMIGTNSFGHLKSNLIANHLTVLKDESIPVGPLTTGHDVFGTGISSSTAWHHSAYRDVVISLDGLGTRFQSDGTIAQGALYIITMSASDHIAEWLASNHVARWSCHVFYEDT